ncbi:aspartate/glutamate racemase family protein [Sediminibacillus massiliensis]|uniref:aspartate/glutamate racemase family protein n=1 Tax=Sediminibacillus massiliensis TaxID=1926277 RepID=UPI0009887575|nr:amino acid racemase [Sediminibacillus massiliensis]
MQYNKLGVLGGMGPKATSVFFDKVIDCTDAHKDQEHIDMVILNHATLPDRTKAILENKGHIFLSAIEKDIKLLETAGVANIAIPCNTSHYFYDEMQKMTDINIINMVEETVKEIAKHYGEGSKVGIMATNGTISTGIYEKTCHKYNMTAYLPAEAMQSNIMNIIYHDIKGDSGENAALKVETIIQELVNKEKCDCIILACTELSVVALREEVSRYCVDAMRVLVNKSIELSEKSKITQK